MEKLGAIEARLPNGTSITTTFEDDLAVDVIVHTGAQNGQGAKMAVMKPRPLTATEILLKDQLAVPDRLQEQK